MTDSLAMWDREVIDTYYASCGIRGTLPWEKTELAALPPKKTVRNTLQILTLFFL